MGKWIERENGSIVIRGPAAIAFLVSLILLGFILGYFLR